ncbi:hypothetical protein [Mycolicibacterium septicum]|uniref:hypothetical protein n=1 Tax=Mycolicibacterium septicum TaxID=98668 RepID=UPI00236288C9|nr:hypothetical protein [Mycolicibacterium septicum]
MQHRRTPFRLLAMCASAIGLTFGTTIFAHAEPADNNDLAVSPYPEMTHITGWYSEHPPEEFFIPDHPGVWFLTPSGMNCGIWDRGGFGCTGDIPGAPPGTNAIAWLNGNRAVHYGWTAAIQFPPGQGQRPLPPRSYVTYNSTTCAITPDGNTFCAHGEFKLLMSPVATWFKGWDDRDSYVCLSYGTCPS